MRSVHIFLLMLASAISSINLGCGGGGASPAGPTKQQSLTPAGEEKSAVSNHSPNDQKPPPPKPSKPPRPTDVR